MRRKDREVTDINEIMSIMKKCSVCSLAFFDEQYPYIVPMNFGFSFDNDVITLYFHGANTGKKLDLLNKNNRVAFEMHCSGKLNEGENACNYSMEYESVCGTGSAEILSDSEKLTAFKIFMGQYTDRADLSYNENAVKVTTLFKVTVNNISGKRKPPAKQ
jgi:nitroimidazol reductase NimA-like FMN-containing flavoprotein (pyridoxamine 5'-phosphate oxidase superfamily)